MKTSSVSNFSVSSVSSATVSSLLASAEARLAQHIWPQLEETAFQCSNRVFEAFLRHRVGSEHFASVTGYGHDDLGRQVLDKVFADALQAEAALVRVQFVSGTHALAVALQGCLQPGHTMLSVTGNPYDTLEEVIGLRGKHPRSLKSQGVTYQAIDLISQQATPEQITPEHAQTIQNAQLIYIQRSRGYSLRPALRIAEIQTICQRIKAINPQALILVDNCYGEFIEGQEPTAVGADLMAGSLIKNPGGGIVPTGGYIAGRADLVKACAGALTCPGVGEKGGYMFDLTRTLLQGLFLAPSVVKEALKGMTLAALLLEEAGFGVTPGWQDLRSDIIQVVEFGDPNKLIAFCQALQSFSPIDSAVTPVPSGVPGYEDSLIMAGGTFIEGSTIELSADGPLRPPYVAFLQGGLTYAHTRFAITHVLEVLGQFN